MASSMLDCYNVYNMKTPPWVGSSDPPGLSKDSYMTHTTSPTIGETAADLGYVGPESMLWKVASHPAFLIGLIPTAIVQALYPPIAAAVDQHDPLFVRLREHGRYMGGAFDRLRRSLSIPITGVYGSCAHADATAAHIRRFHDVMRGTEPVTGREYVAGDPDHMLYAGLTTMYFGLVSYEIYGPGPVSNHDRACFYKDSAQMLERLGVPAQIIPATPEEVDRYFERVNPTLCVSESALTALEFMFQPKIGGFPRDRYAWERVATYVPARIAIAAGIAITPRRVRRLMGVRQSSMVDAMLIAIFQPLLRMMALPALDDLTSRLLLGPELARRKRHGQRIAATPSASSPAA